MENKWGLKGPKKDNFILPFSNPLKGKKKKKEEDHHYGFANFKYPTGVWSFWTFAIQSVLEHLGNSKITSSPHFCQE